MRTVIALIAVAIALLLMTVNVLSEEIYLPVMRSYVPDSTPTGAATATSTSTATATGTATRTPTPTQTATSTATATQTPTATPTQPVGGPCPCDADILNCSDFNTQPQAQACYDWCVGQGAGDIHKLDSDDDGEACESLPPFSRVLR